MEDCWRRPKQFYNSLLNPSAPKRDDVKEDERKHRLTSVSKVERDDTVDQDGNDNVETKFGWLWFRPKCLQVSFYFYDYFHPGVLFFPSFIN